MSKKSMHQRKIVKQEMNTTSKKIIKEVGYSSDSLNLVWRFDRIDRDGKFAFDIGRNDFNHKIVIEKLLSYSIMTWADIKKQTHDKGKSKHHFLSVDKLSNDALDRIRAKDIFDESDSIFSFALENKLRIIGIRQNEFFYVMWYDPEHEFCPSKR